LNNLLENLGLSKSNRAIWIYFLNFDRKYIENILMETITIYYSKQITSVQMENINLQFM